MAARMASATYVTSFCALGQGGQEGRVDADRYHLAWPIAARFPTTLAEPIDVIAASAQSWMSCSVTGLPWIFSTAKAKYEIWSRPTPASKSLN